MPHQDSWWLDWSALPDLHWARLRVFEDGASEVFDLDGKTHRFETEDEARHWLSEDEYSALDTLMEQGEVVPTVAPPAAATDAALVRLMVVRRS
jgi:hypothetical protein